MHIFADQVVEEEEEEEEEEEKEEKGREEEKKKKKKKKKEEGNKVTVFVLSVYLKCSENHHPIKIVPDDFGHMGLQYYYTEFACVYWEQPQ